MRPRQMPRNFVTGLAGTISVDEASMRPRQMPRNFFRPARRPCAPHLRFNEAAADAAEFSSAACITRAGFHRFNEAAADAAEFYIGGELGELVLAGFNEAAADAAEFFRQREHDPHR